MAVKLFTDSSCDLPMEVIKSNKIIVVPLRITFDNESYLDRVNLEVSEFYQKMREHEELPKTAAPSPHDYLEILEQELGPQDEGIIITLSSQLSSTLQSAKMAIEMYKEKYSNAKVVALDSKNASVGLGLIMIQAAKLRDNGLAFAEIVKKIRDVIDKTHTLILLDSLENTIKGGRLDKVRGKVATILSIKVLMKNSFQGSIDIIDKVRGSNKAVSRLLDFIGMYGENLEEKFLAIAHSECEEKAIKLKKMIEERYKTAKIIITEIGPTVGTYAGEGGILISF
ncbi:hypothetical protein BHF71_09480 [Vulcanibacillus modesticaldus]|uniref:Fatty acid-binding protein DegV n=1 Tax=Vulcanibacillus modesticaldus TaxID=337097 RepID=A0A1D2YU99_9BACI|nr:DegV family protein [Vulcanibacillus modesticaldus]OEF99256.1 hypothetical protein BHF71_09480 [Vulcanibacillus modesticaldus]